MSNEIKFTVNLYVKNGNLTYQGIGPSSFQMDQTNPSAPVGNGLLVPTAGVNVDLSQLTTPGACEIYNTDSTNYVTAGIWDPETGRFYPFLELQPGMKLPLLLARNIEEELGTGTGTIGANTNRLHLRANNAPCWVFVGVFDR